MNSAMSAFGTKRTLKDLRYRGTPSHNLRRCVECAAQPSQSRNADTPGTTQTNGSGRRRGQINIPTLNPRAAIVNANCDASTVTDTNVRAKRQSAMSRCHCRAIYSLPIGCATSAITVTSAVDACHLCMCSARKQH